MSKVGSAIIILVIAFFGYRNFTLIQEKFAKPCSKPITYNIGSFDKRFGISQSDFLLALTQAESILEKPIGRELFTYTETKAKLPVNLIYDERQQVTEELGQIKTTVEGTEATYKSMEAQYKSLKSQEESLRNTYDSAVETFNQHNSEYEQAVAKWNASQRNSKGQFEQLETSRKALEQELAQLKTLEGQLNTSVRQLNTLVANLNQLAKQLNLKVDQYNTIGASRGETFTGGTYTSDENGERIDIYEFDNHTKLVRILAHELGHALGLDHVDDSQAIMYAYNEGSALKATDADIIALKTLCKIN